MKLLSVYPLSLLVLSFLKGSSSANEINNVGMVENEVDTNRKHLLDEISKIRSEFLDTIKAANTREVEEVLKKSLDCTHLNKDELMKLREAVRGVLLSCQDSKAVEFQSKTTGFSMKRSTLELEIRAESDNILKKVLKHCTKEDYPKLSTVCEEDMKLVINEAFRTLKNKVDEFKKFALTPNLSEETSDVVKACFTKDVVDKMTTDALWEISIDRLCEISPEAVHTLL